MKKLHHKQFLGAGTRVIIPIKTPGLEKYYNLNREHIIVILSHFLCCFLTI